MLDHIGRPTKYTALLTIFIATYSGVMSSVTLLRYYTFRTYADLFLFSQAFFTALHGKLFYETADLGIIPSGSFLGTHFAPLVFLLLPVYAVYPAPETLLVLQTIFVALGAVPVYLISRHVLGKPRLSLALAAIYLTNPAIQALNIYDFHLEAFLPFFLGMLYYSLLTRRWKVYIVFLALSFITIEFGALMVVAISGAALLSERANLRILLLHPKKIFNKDYISSSIPIITIPLALAVFYALLVASALVGGIGASPQKILTGFLPPPGQGIEADIPFKLLFWFLLLSMVMFLPILAPTRLLMVLPWLAVTILVQPGLRTFYLIGYQDSGAFVAPYLILASIHALRLVPKTQVIKRILIAIFLISFLLSPLNPVTQRLSQGIAYEAGLPIPTSHDAILYEAMSLIPQNASVLAQVDLISHLSNRSNAFFYLPNGVLSTQYILADQTSPFYLSRPFNFEPISKILAGAFSSGDYGLLAYVDGIILLERNYSGPVVLMGQNQRTFNYQQLLLHSGSLISDPSSKSSVVFLHKPTDPNGVTFWFGPYATFIPGRYNASFYLKDSSNTTGSLTLDVSLSVNSTYSEDLTRLTITPASFLSPGNWQPFTLNFTLAPQASVQGSLEFRAPDVSGGPFYFDYVLITYVRAP